ncbi:hypothetical protein EMIHUDRAFT_471709 [Emiliania huxleyi CCMP1516]|uniref:Pentacotripeptide-repeat region of PRORP domain-containing protein n=2 Tax=Emiliania huxleyi TaxID=2903 RepID=A0A0D3JJM5_EMIH1|nr:hypothetical protein EMIHUDRAFT_471709 [Emiliania huxleyi CCMP1516]EOD23710.1 hypothetical protein EMIHUDRAFT_471709 [Emiliania huxleyi CCMP1516]|eukprot:XP_005776139.1 hypothetical protein EMIHUDRAFT_471709 [Emiliania huxleyi CCMP1516]
MCNSRLLLLSAIAAPARGLAIAASPAGAWWPAAGADAGAAPGLGAGRAAAVPAASRDDWEEGSYSAAIVACADSGDWESACSLLREMDGAGFRIQGRPLTAALRATAAAGEWGAAMSLRRTAQERGVALSRAGYAHLIGLAVDSGRDDDAARLYAAAAGERKFSHWRDDEPLTLDLHDMSTAVAATAVRVQVVPDLVRQRVAHRRRRHRRAHVVQVKCERLVVTPVTKLSLPGGGRVEARGVVVAARVDGEADEVRVPCARQCHAPLLRRPPQRHRGAPLARSRRRSQRSGERPPLDAEACAVHLAEQAARRLPVTRVGAGDDRRRV